MLLELARIASTGTTSRKEPQIKLVTLKDKIATFNFSRVLSVKDLNGNMYYPPFSLPKKLIQDWY